jgi:flagellar assembly protein FliH
MRDWRLELDQLLVQAQRQAADIVREATKQAESIRERAQRKGYETGLKQGLSEGEQRGAEEALAAGQATFDENLAHLADNLAAVVREVSDERRDRLHAAEHDLLNFAIDIAGRVTKVIGESNPDAARENLRSALKLVMSNSDLAVKVHPADLTTLRQFAAELAEENTSLPHITITEDGAVSRGGVQVLTESGRIDATLEAQMDQITRALTGGSE